MIIKTLSIKSSSDIFQGWMDNNNLPKIEDNIEIDCEPEYLGIRQNILDKYLQLKMQLDAGQIKPYELDCLLSLSFYEYISVQPWFNSRIASNEDFWRYVSMKIIPDVIGNRFEGLDKRHFYSKGTRVYPYTLYWYTYLSFQTSLECTKTMLQSPRFSTDTIVGLVERTGRSGTFITLYRHIMNYFANFYSTKKIDYISLFRSVMKLCMAKTQVIDPDLCQGGPKQYAENLVNECVLNLP